jgi:hypothetical protein
MEKSTISDFFSKLQCSPFGLQIPLFCSKTSLYILKLIVRMKKKIMAPFLLLAHWVEPLCPGSNKKVNKL